MASKLDKIKSNTEKIKSLTDENTKLLEELQSLQNATYISSINNRRILKNNRQYTFTFPNLKEFTDKLKIVIDGILTDSCVSESRGHILIYFTDKYGFVMNNDSHFFLRGLGKLEEHTNLAELDLYVRFKDGNLILYDDYVKTTFSGGCYKDTSVEFSFNTLTQTSEPNIYSYEFRSCNSRQMVCPQGEKKENRCDCYYKSVGNYDAVQTIKCTHVCTCSDGKYPFRCWVPKFKCTVNIATFEIYLYIDFS